MYEQIKEVITKAEAALDDGQSERSIAFSLIALATILNESRDADNSFSVGTFPAQI